MKRMGMGAIVCAAALAVACGNGNGRVDKGDVVGTTGEAAVDRSVHDSDRDFINQMLGGGTAEVDLGKLAVTHAASADVKRFGQMMVQDHTKAGDELKKIAATWKVEPMPKVADKHQDLMNRLAKLKGAEFDREYMKAMVDDHEEDVDELQSRVDSEASLKDRITNKDSANARPVPERSNNAPKADVNAWAANALPVVRHHLDEAKMIKDKLDKAPHKTAAHRG